MFWPLRLHPEQWQWWGAGREWRSPPSMPGSLSWWTQGCECSSPQRQSPWHYLSAGVCPDPWPPLPADNTVYSTGIVIQNWILDPYDQNIIEQMGFAFYAILVILWLVLGFKHHVLLVVRIQIVNLEMPIFVLNAIKVFSWKMVNVIRQISFVKSIIFWQEAALAAIMDTK